VSAVAWLQAAGVSGRGKAMSRDAKELVVAHMLYAGFLCLDFGYTAYATTAYLKAGAKAAALRAGKDKVSSLAPPNARFVPPSGDSRTGIRWHAPRPTPCAFCTSVDCSSPDVETGLEESLCSVTDFAKLACVQLWIEVPVVSPDGSSDPGPSRSQAGTVVGNGSTVARDDSGIVVLSSDDEGSGEWAPLSKKPKES
jgi:hypothetical protein